MRVTSGRFGWAVNQPAELIYIFLNCLNVGFLVHLSFGSILTPMRAGCFWPWTCSMQHEAGFSGSSTRWAWLRCSSLRRFSRTQPWHYKTIPWWGEEIGPDRLGGFFDISIVSVGLEFICIDVNPTKGATRGYPAEGKGGRWGPKGVQTSWLKKKSINIAILSPSAEG